MPAIDFNLMKNLFPEQKQKEIITSVFGTDTDKARLYAEQKDSETRRLVQDMFDARRKEIEKQRTDDIRLSAFNSLGNALRTMVQPLGWAAGGGGFSGATAGLQAPDNRQYLEAFNRAVKANDELRNIGTKEMEYNIKFADKDAERAWARYDALDDSAELAKYQKKADIDLKKQEAINKMRHEARMEEIDKRYGWQKDIAEIRGNFQLMKQGKAADESAVIDAEKKFNTFWKDYMARIATLDATPGIDMSNQKIYTKEEMYEIFMGNQGFKVQRKGGTNTAGGNSGSGSGSGNGSRGHAEL